MRALIQSICQRRKYLQSRFHLNKFLPISGPQISTFSSILKSCSSLPYLDAGQVSHGYLIKCGVFGCCFDLGNWLQQVYVKFGGSHVAHKVFEEMLVRNNGDVIACITSGLGINRTSEDVVDAFEMMVELCVFPSVNSLCHVIRACRELNSIKKSKFVHSYVKENGFEKHLTIMNSLISMYSKMGRLDLAQQVFDEIVFKDIVSWNSLITGYAQNENWEKVFELFVCLRGADDLVPNVVTFLALLSSVREASSGMSIHGHVISMGSYSDVQLGTAIFNMYANCGRLDYAEIVFKQDLISKTLVSWNSIIAAYKREGYEREAARIYEHMLVEQPDMKPDMFSFANVLPVYGSLGDIDRVKVIHSVIIQRGLNIEKDVVLSTAMLDAYGKCSEVRAAEFLFSHTTNPNTGTWNALIAVYILNDQIEDGVNLFHQMVRSKVSLDSITIVTFCQLCGQTGSFQHANMFHAFTLVKGFSSHLTVGNALIDMYMKCGYARSAELVFHSMSVKNIVTWNTMISRVGFSSSAGLILFQQMQSEYKPDSVTIISLLQTGCLGSSHLEQLHAYIVKYGLASETQVINSLIDAFAKMGNIDMARKAFMQTDFMRDRSSWNIMIAGYGMNGQGSEASKLFSQMETEVSPDTITFTSLLSSCSHCGLVEDGCKFFELMITKYKIEPSIEHWTCIIDMLGRANGLELIERSGVYGLDSVAVWGAVLNACRLHMNMEVGEVVGKKLSGNFKYYSLLSNLYSSNNRWNEATKVRNVFGDGQVTKKTGLSSLKT